MYHLNVVKCNVNQTNFDGKSESLAVIWNFCISQGIVMLWWCIFLCHKNI